MSESELARRRCPVLIIVETLWLWRSFEIGCSAVRFTASAPNQDRSVGKTDLLGSI